MSNVKSTVNCSMVPHQLDDEVSDIKPWQNTSNFAPVTSKLRAHNDCLVVQTAIQYSNTKKNPQNVVAKSIYNLSLKQIPDKGRVLSHLHYLKVSQASYKPPHYAWYSSLRELLQLRDVVSC